MFNILVTGANGQLGSEIREIAPNYRAYNFLFTDVDDLDILNKNLLNDFVDRHNINMIINCAAFTDVDIAEDEKELAYKVNAEGTKNLLDSCELVGAKLIHYSTDYVFDGNSKKPYSELDIPNPKSVYGLSKLKGEEYILANNKVSSMIIRTSWVYSSYGKNFVKKIIKLGSENKELGIVSDQIGSPTYAKDLAEDTLNILSDNKYKWSQGDIFHYSNGGSCSWFEFAEKIFEKTNIAVKINKLNSRDYHTKASRPKYSTLDKSKFQNIFNIQIKDWEISLSEMLKQELAL